MLVSPIGNSEGNLVLNGETLQELPEFSPEIEGKEKHIPVIEIDGNKVRIFSRGWAENP